MQFLIDKHIGVDLFISFLVICYKIFNGNNTDLGHTISGFLFRCSYYCWMISCAKKSVYIT